MTEKREHAIHNASASNIWLHCGQYYVHKVAAEEAGEDYDTSGDAARRGTVLHDICETAMRLRLAGDDNLGSSLIAEASDSVGEKYSALKQDHLYEAWGALTDSDLEQAQIAFRAVEDVIQENKCSNVGLEVPVPLSHEEGSTGKVDVLAFNSRVLIILDYKFGQGKVPPDSSQNKIYGSNAIEYLTEKFCVPNIEEVKLGIVQPAHHSEALIVPFNPRYLLKFRGHVEHVAEGQIEGTDLGGASDLNVCTWCPFKARCSTHTQLLIAQTEELEVPAEKNDTEAVERIVRQRTALKKAIDEYAAEVATNTERFPNWKRVVVSNGVHWNEGSDPTEIAFSLRLQGVAEPYVLDTPASLKKKFPDAVEEIDVFTVPAGSHTRLYYKKPTENEEFAVEGEEDKPRERTKPKTAPKKKAAAKKPAKKPAKKAAAKRTNTKKTAAKKPAAKKGKS